ncbi:MAG: SDR family oxidoreductase [Campylobacteraceae bacterium]|jgi:3-oxoacyl-[acyl-carrier protein] reductase|nr:SDR family oxidoreductase [Campylobacteraceae bacterium]
MSKSVLITGSTGAIGEAIAQEFFECGYKLYLHYNKNEHKAKELAKKFDAQILQWDMRDKDTIKKVIGEMGVDVLINNAAITNDAHIYWMNDEQWQSVIETNLNGTYYVTKALLPQMIKNKKGSIINVVSISGMVGNHGQANYSATKGALIAFTKTLCLDLARFNIRVNAVAPGLISSEMSKNIDEKSYKSIIPLGRFGKPEEVAKAIFFLGDSASYISGEVLNVSGGMIR